MISLISFWADCGVECAYEASAQNRLRPKTPPAAARAQEPQTIPALLPEADPQKVAQGLAAGAATLEDLEAAIAAFEGCSLIGQGASRPVFSRGRPDAPIMVIGEAPGGEEDRLGQPFVGPAGKLLDRMLVSAGLADEVFITNTVFWRPPGNRTPTMAEQASCLPFVERAIELVQPRCLVFAGGAAAKSMLKTTEGILSLRGRWVTWVSTTTSIEIPALPILHPSFLLRQPIAKKKAWADLLSLQAKLRDRG